MSTAFNSLGYIAGVNLDDSRFTSADLLSAETILAQAIMSYDHTQDASPGTTLDELVVRIRALIYLTSKTQVQAALATLSLKSISEHPSLSSDAVVDDILSNWGITRSAGMPATGLVRISVSRNAVYLIPVTQQFVTSQGQVFTSQSSYVVLTNPSGVNQLKLFAADSLGDQFYFLVPVVAEESGLSYQLSSQTSLTPQPAISNLVSCFSFGEFYGALDEESSSSLIARLPDGLAAKNLISRASLRSTVRSSFPSLQSLSVQGFGDPALLRGGDNIFGIKTPGRADVWIRTLPGLQVNTIATLATRININSDGTALYSVSLSASQTQAAYLCSAILPSTADFMANGGVSSSILGSYSINSQSYGFDSTNSGDRIQNATEAAFSAYSTLTCQFTVSPVDRTLDSTIPVQVQTIGQPNIVAIQEFLDNPDTRAACADYLVKAAIPCFCSISPITIYADASVDPALLKTAIYRMIVQTDPGTPLLIDEIVLTLRQIAGVLRVDLPIRLAGRIYSPDGTTIDLQSQNGLVIPNLPDKQIVPETVAWFISMDNISLNVIYSS